MKELFIVVFALVAVCGCTSFMSEVSQDEAVAIVLVLPESREYAADCRRRQMETITLTGPRNTTCTIGSNEYWEVWVCEQAEAEKTIGRGVLHSGMPHFLVDCRSGRVFIRDYWSQQRPELISLDNWRQRNAKRGD